MLSFYESQLQNGAVHIYNMTDIDIHSQVCTDSGNGPLVPATYGPYGAGVSLNQSISAHAPGLVGDQDICIYTVGSNVEPNVVTPYHDVNGTGSFSVELLFYNTLISNAIFFPMVNDNTDQTGRGFSLVVGANAVQFVIGGSAGNVALSISLPYSTLNVPAYIGAAYDAATGDVQLWYYDPNNGTHSASGTGAVYRAAAHQIQINGPGFETYGDGYAGYAYYSSVGMYYTALTPTQFEQNIANIPNPPPDPATVSLNAYLSINGSVLVLVPVDAVLPYNETQLYRVRLVRPDGFSEIPTGVFTTSAGTMDPAGVTSSGEALLIPDEKIGVFEVSFVELP